jgi:hypothetical protein
MGAAFTGAAVVAALGGLIILAVYRTPPAAPARPTGLADRADQMATG